MLTSSLRLSPIIMTSFGGIFQVSHMCNRGAGSGLYGLNSLLRAGMNFICSKSSMNLSDMKNPRILWRKETRIQESYGEKKQESKNLMEKRNKKTHDF
jgi:hypothetical protein